MRGVYYWICCCLHSPAAAAAAATANCIVYYFFSSLRVLSSVFGLFLFSLLFFARHNLSHRSANYLQLSSINYNYNIFITGSHGTVYQLYRLIDDFFNSSQFLILCGIFVCIASTHRMHVEIFRRFHSSVCVCVSICLSLQFRSSYVERWIVWYFTANQTVKFVYL